MNSFHAVLRDIATSSFALVLCCAPSRGGPPEPTRAPLVRVVDLDRGETMQLILANGAPSRVKLTALSETRDSLRGAVRDAKVTVEVNGQTAVLNAGNYHLPQTIGGVRIDCPITRGYVSKAEDNKWGLAKDARLRLWPAGSPLMAPGTMGYPVKQRWFASSSQMANEPTHVDGGERPGSREIYYHNDLDFGGGEGLIDVVAATDGRVISVGGQRLPGYEDTPAGARHDVVYVLDEQGWYFRYSHLFDYDPAIRPGAQIKRGQKIAVFGKAGGWSHLHFGIVSRQPSGQWGTQEAYALVWEAYLQEYQPKILAVARPHHFVGIGEKVILDGSKSWCAAGKIARYEWRLNDGTRAGGPRVERSYATAGVRSEVLRVEDTQGNVAYDFAVVQVADASNPNYVPMSIHPSYAPTLNLKPGDKVTFKVRTFGTTDGQEVWDFGDGTPPAQTKSDGNARGRLLGYAAIEHAYSRPGIFVVKVERSNARGEAAIGHLAVTIEP